MSEGCPTVSSSSSSSGRGGGIACLRRQFELHLDVVCEPQKPGARPRPSSLRVPKAFFKKTDENEEIDRPALGPIPESKLKLGRSSSSVQSSSSSSSLFSNLPEQTLATVREPDGRTELAAELQDIAVAEDAKGIVTSCSSSSQDCDTTTSPAVASLADESDEAKSTSAPCSSFCLEASPPDPISRESQDKVVKSPLSPSGTSTIDRCQEEKGEQNWPTFSASPSCSLPNSAEVNHSNGGVAKAKAEGTPRSLDRGVAAKQSAPPKDTIPLNDCTSGRKKVARSMEDLLCASPATPTKETNTFRTDSRDRKCNGDHNSAQVTTSHLTKPLATPTDSNEKSPLRAKKPPPPVPKKTAKSVANAKRKALQEIASPPNEGLPMSDCGENQTALNVQTPTKKCVRPTTLLPPPKQKIFCDDLNEDDDDDDDDDRFKSLPNLGCINRVLSEGDLLSERNRKDTLFPCHRQKPRPQLQSKMHGSDDDLLDSSSVQLSPLVPRKRWLVMDRPLLPSPMSLGTRTPPDLDSLIASGEGVQGTCTVESSYVSHNWVVCPLSTPTTDDQMDIVSMMNPGSPPACPPSSLSESMNSAAKEVDVREISPKDSDTEMFLSDTFDFLDETQSPGNDDENTDSPLKSWTDTWYRSQNNLKSETTSSESRLRTNLAKGSPLPTGCALKADLREKILRVAEEKYLDRESCSHTSQSEKKGNAGENESSKRNGVKTAESKIDLKTSGSVALRKGIRHKTEDKGTSKDADQSGIFDVVLRRSSVKSVSRRSTPFSAVVAAPTYVTKGKRPESFASQTVAVRTSSTPFAKGCASPAAAAATAKSSSSPVAPRSFSRLPSLPLTIMSSERPVRKTPGKYVGGNPSVILDGRSVYATEKGKSALQMEIDVIDSAFEFLDDSGA